MAAAVCPRCQRANPGEAVYCHFDGFALHPNGGPLSAGGTFSQTFVFPSGRKCKTFDQLVQGCQEEWEEARTLLRGGGFQKFLAAIGRMDLARSADETRGQLDADIALHDFVAALPATQVKGPRLELTPRRLVLDGMHVGETRQVKITVSNGGKGLLQGKLAVDEGGSWLHLIDGNDTGQCSLKTAREQVITALIDTRGLAAPRKHAARLTVITNGGIAEVPVGLEVVSYPFSHSPFKGIASPREMAERMRGQPKQAVAFLESGEMARWFAANGWAYPVAGATAKGVAAVQQFFEGMGLSKPPAVQLSMTEIRLSCQQPEVIRGEVALLTPSKKWVYAQADSQEPWLRVTTPSVSGPQQAVVAYEVDSKLMKAGRQSEGTLGIVANAGQKLALRVKVDVRKSPISFQSNLLNPVLMGALVFFCYRLLMALPVDMFARLLGSDGGTYENWLHAPSLEGRFAVRFVLATWWLGAMLGGMRLWQRGGRWMDVPFGVLAGGVAGVLSSASLACLWPLLDSPGRLLWRGLAPLVQGHTVAAFAWLWTPLWILVAALSWAAVGALVVLVLGLIGNTGSRLLGVISRPLIWALGVIGWRRLQALVAKT
jgi:hypothetical protein